MFSQRLKQLRKEKGITQDKLAKHFNLCTSTVGNWEIGKRQPDHDMLRNLSDYFGVTLDYLMGRSDTAQKNPLDENLSDIDFALFGEVRDMTEEQKQDVLNYIKYKKSQSGN